MGLILMGMKLMDSFIKDISKGKIGELIFKEDFLDFLNITYKDVSNCQSFQVLDTDYSCSFGTYEIKTNYMDNKKIIIEEFTNINENLGVISTGWFYKSKAKILVFISKKTRVMVLVPFTDSFKNKYELIKDKQQLIKNKISDYGVNKWQSAFRIIDLKDIDGYYSFYQKRGSDANN